MNKSIPALTGIRGVSAIWVVFYHLQDMGQHDPRLAYLARIRLFREGFRGVDLFFLLSGFILMYVHHADFINLQRETLQRFFAARFWRVYPLNAVVLILIIALGRAMPSVEDPTLFTPYAVVQSLALAQRWFIPDYGAINGPTWSLSVEMVGYAAFPIIALVLNRLSRRRQIAGIAGVLLAGLILASVILHFTNSNVTGRLGLLRMFPTFVAGAALALFFVRDHEVAHGVQRATWRSWLAAVSLLLVITVCSFPTFAWLAVFPIAGLVLGLAYKKGIVDRLMTSGPILWIGKISFSLYLTHFVALNVFAVVLGAAKAGSGRVETLLIAPLALAWVLALAAMTYHFFERPIVQLGRKLIHQPIAPALCFPIPKPE